MYEYIWQNEFITLDAKTIDDFILTFESLAMMFQCWKDAGIILDPADEGVGCDQARFITDSKEVADEFMFTIEECKSEVD